MANVDKDWEISVKACDFGLLPRAAESLEETCSRG